MDIKPEKIKEIAEELDMGMLCFYHKTTGEVETYPDEMKNPGFDEEFWTEVMDKIEKNHSDYIRIEGMPSFEAFKIMEAFIDNMEHIPTHNKFIAAISRKKPFRQFSELLGYYPDLRSNWFAFKLDAYMDYVRTQFKIEE